MYGEKLKESVGGVIGSFVIRNREIIESDLQRDLQFVTQSVFYLMDAVTEKKDLKYVTISGENCGFYVYFHQDYVIGVVIAPNANTHLLNLMIRRLLESPEQKEVPQERPLTLEDYVPYFDRPAEDVIPNVPQYARQVLVFVDGKRTIREIMAVSHLPPEVVLDVILSYRRSSVIHYRE